MNKTELIHQIMMLGAETYEKTHSEIYDAQLKAEKLLDEYFCDMKTGDSALLDAVFSQLCRWIDNCEQQVEIFLKNGLTISSTSSNAMAQAYWNVKILIEENRNNSIETEKEQVNGK